MCPFLLVLPLYDLRRTLGIYFQLVLNSVAVVKLLLLSHHVKDRQCSLED